MVSECIKFLKDNNAIHHENIFAIPGDQNKIKKLLDILIKCESIPVQTDIDTVASTLKIILISSNLDGIIMDQKYPQHPLQIVPGKLLESFFFPNKTDRSRINNNNRNSNVDKKRKLQERISFYLNGIYKLDPEDQQILKQVILFLHEIGNDVNFEKSKMNYNKLSKVINQSLLYYHFNMATRITDDYVQNITKYTIKIIQEIIENCYQIFAPDYSSKILVNPLQKYAGDTPDVNSLPTRQDYEDPFTYRGAAAAAAAATSQYEPESNLSNRLKREYEFQAAAAATPAPPLPKTSAAPAPAAAAATATSTQQSDDSSSLIKFNSDNKLVNNIVTTKPTLDSDYFNKIKNNKTKKNNRNSLANKSAAASAKNASKRSNNFQGAAAAAATPSITAAASASKNNTIPINQSIKILNKINEPGQNGFNYARVSNQMFFRYNSRNLIFNIDKTYILKYRFVLKEVFEKFYHYLYFINGDKKDNNRNKKGKEFSELFSSLAGLAGLELTLDKEKEKEKEKEEFKTKIMEFFGFKLTEEFDEHKYLREEFLNRPSQLKTLINNTLQKINELQENKIKLDLKF
jgi:hypothetical protein